MMNKLLALSALSATTVSAAKISPKMKKNLETMQRDGISAGSSFGRHLINKSRRVEQADNYEKDISFISNYSIKFMGCHHVTQWSNEEEQEEQDEDNQDEGATLNAANGRIRSKGLVRFRLCPSDSCFDNFGAGCSSNYGEYVVDMYNFLSVYIAWQMEEEEYKCETYRSTCYNECFESATANCYSNCYKRNGVNAALCSKNGNNNNNNNNNGGYSNYDAYASNYGNEFDLEDYLECGEYEVYEEGGDEVAHYLGPYCANQGGDIKLGFFQDQYCSIPSSYQASYFEKMTGLEIPYTKTSLVTTTCMSCEETEQYAEAQNGNDYYNYDADGNRNYYIAKEVNEMCSELYMTSGKCEVEFSKDDVPYPEEGACTYIEGVKRLQDDGIIRSNQTISSKPASVAIGIFTSLAVLLGGYVYYLKSKIQRSRVNLAGATTSLA
eukprot:CAMPEP_0172525522 /NCGR_PEP_ID=MMETSP1067-20121228/561_1 /TAXON_ID=265564 ORGANISM="Thalassiosira punctigera, Strain Tpunct2005C2" /NCGR_SAMPLE_ID=MMETSP1067 /ASSEMBLY_ACC=CAM_ASM_000444 /LENGTH=437 /DNA_ID=CAMNT_0013308799 /DNA_START=96 /DNA_END=1409 /DNA_ORIENTATION=+